VGRMLQDLDLRKRCNATILVVKRGASVTVVPPSGFVFEKNDVIVVFGPNKMIDEIYENENR
jgi:K+/H+ antiporter YhaU regulatory subunit KhtT